MVNSFLIKFKWIFFICLAGFFAFCLPLQINAGFAPQIFVRNLKISEIKNGEIKGEFNIWNSESYYLNNLNYQVKLFNNGTPKEFELIDEVVSKETFFVPPNKTITKSFSYAFPQNIISGDYVLRVRIITDRGTELGWQDQKVSLAGENNFLEMHPALSKVLLNGKVHTPLEGINISPSESVTALLEVKNPGDAITVVPHIKIFNRQINMPVFKEYQDSPIAFTKGETKKVQLQMPKIDIPESYLAEVKFYKDNEQVSGIQYFRWVVEGEGGKILYVKADKDYFRAGESINLTVQSIGPADGVDIGGGQLEVIVSDKNGNLIAKTSKEVSLTSDLVFSAIAIPIKKDLITPEINVKLTKNGKVLDERTINLPKFSEGAKALEQEMLEKARIKMFLIYLSLSLAALILILVSGFLLYKFKIKKNQWKK